MPQTTGTLVDREQGGNYPEDLYSGARVATLVPDAEAFDSVGEKTFGDDGFIGIENLLTPLDVTEVIEGLTSVLEHPGGAMVEYEAWGRDRLPDLSGAERMDAVRKFMFFTTENARLEALARDPRILRVVRRLCGSEDVTMIQEMALLKPPGGGREKPWHQDNAFFNYEPGTPIVGVWIALDEATTANGCMHVAPGSHRQGPVIHFRRRDFQICDTQVDRDADTAVPLPPGGALFFHGLLHHGTPANFTNSRRRAVQLHYVPYGTPGVPESRRLDIFGHEGKDASC